MTLILVRSLKLLDQKNKKLYERIFFIKKKSVFTKFSHALVSKQRSTANRMQQNRNATYLLNFQMKIKNVFAFIFTHNVSSWLHNDNIHLFIHKAVKINFSFKLKP